MFLIILILAIYITVKSISYAIYEIKENKNKIGDKRNNDIFNINNNVSNVFAKKEI